jgi:hypothetical protein
LVLTYRLEEYDIPKNRVVLKYKDAKLVVDTTFLVDFHGKPLAYYSFSGEITYNGTVTLHARTHNEMIDFNAEIYEKALMKRRDFLRQ